MKDFKKDKKFGKNEPRRGNPGGAGFGGPGRSRNDSDRTSYGPARRFNEDPGRSERRSFRKPDFQKEMHSVTCDKCGQRCEVPFRPTAGKPVYCSNCFKKDGSSESKAIFRKERFAATGSDGEFGKELDGINRKLDLILDALAKR